MPFTHSYFLTSTLIQAPGSITSSVTWKIDISDTQRVLHGLRRRYQVKVARASNNLLSNGTNDIRTARQPQRQYRQTIEKFLLLSGDGTLKPRPH
ncbi:hypothetical protein K456DRAFT_55174 [Colletotrichum gloeosporioides 23]|nr:hypothetical protein K456DRAFT_55174 [Colletotrichum gloeosporioides 23]